MPLADWYKYAYKKLGFFFTPVPSATCICRLIVLSLSFHSLQPQMYRLSVEPLPRLISDADSDDRHGESVEVLCSECGTYCDYPNHFYTPPQSPSEMLGFSNLTNLDVSIYNSALASQNTSTNCTETPCYPHAPPSTPITAQEFKQTAPIQFWSSDVYKSTINFPPTELPDHLRDTGAWRHMPAQAELAILFGPEAATPFNWTPTGPVHDDGDISSVPAIKGAQAAIPKFFWGPLRVDCKSVGTQTLPYKRSLPCVELRVRDKTASTQFDSEEEVVSDSNA